mmetsp:Transcript_30269/g.51186  ORF Transcript_30269/g.51186 Transcript_30269/m.51186 type:complete len:130 (-) Transcript_30269:521-910(-)
MAAFPSGGAKFPAQLHHLITVDGESTDIISTVYSDRIFVIISQLDKFGTLLKAWSEPRSDGGMLFQVSTLLGKRDDPLLHIYARQIIERMAQVTQKPLLLAIALKPECRSADNFQTILNELFQHNAWLL